MTDNITLPRSVVEQALEALFMYKPMVTGVTFQHGLDAMQALRAALEQPPTTEQSSVVQPQANQPAMTPIAQRKLDSLLAEGYTISGYSVYHERKHQHGFVTGAGLVGWWKPEGMEYPQPLGGQEPVAWVWFDANEKPCSVTFGGPNINTPKDWGVSPLYTHQQNLRCKSTQARLATLWGYVKEQSQGEQEPIAWANINKQGDIIHTSNKKTAWAKTPIYTYPQPPRQPLTDEQIDGCWYQAGGLSAPFARAIERAHGIGGEA